MHDELARLMDGDGDVEGHPEESQPARPVVAAEQEDPDDDGQEFCDFDPNGIRLVGDQSVKVSGEADGAHREIEAGEQGDREWAAHMRDQGTGFRVQRVAYRKAAGAIVSPGWRIFPYFSWGLT